MQVGAREVGPLGQHRGHADRIGQRIARGRVEQPGAHPGLGRLGPAAAPVAVEIAAHRDRQHARFVAPAAVVAVPPLRCGITLDPLAERGEVQIGVVAVIGVLDEHPVMPAFDLGQFIAEHRKEVGVGVEHHAVEIELDHRLRQMNGRDDGAKLQELLAFRLRSIEQLTHSGGFLFFAAFSQTHITASL